MPYLFEYSEKLQKILDKMSKKNSELYKQILNKIQEIISSRNVEHYKNLRHDLKEFKRVHIGHFVLVFKFNKTKNLVSLEDFDHHDKIYLKKHS
jgi:YafQ family addiction module toxin component